MMLCDWALRALPSGNEFLTTSGVAHTYIVLLLGLLKKRRSGGHAARNMKFKRMTQPTKAANSFCRRLNPF